MRKVVADRLIPWKAFRLGHPPHEKSQPWVVVQVVVLCSLSLRKSQPWVVVQMEVLWSLRLREQVSLDDTYMKELCFLLHRKTQPWVVVQVASRGAVVTIAQEDATVGGCASRGAVVTPSQDVAVVGRSGLDGIAVEPLPKLEELYGLDELSHREFLAALKEGALEDVVLIRQEAMSVELNSSSVMDPEELDDENKSHHQQRYGSAISKNSADPFYPLLKEFADVVSEDPPSVLPPDRGVQHEIDLEPGTKYCTRQWPLHKEEVDTIDAFFAAKHAAGMVRESKSPHFVPNVLCAETQWEMAHGVCF